MIFVILLVLFLVLLLFCIIKDWEVGGCVSILCCGMFLSIFMGMFLSGITDYAYLQKEKVHVQELINGIEKVKNSYYKQISVSLGKLVNGSIENMNQSTNLSRYVSETMVKKAEYNAYLKKCQIYESEFVYNIIGDGFCINKKVRDMKPIE